MTDKQIIIDGVDVSGCHNKTFYKNDEGDVQCKCYRFEDADSDTLLFGICKQHPHCYYKQFKRKEQECEELKKKQRCAWKSLEGTFCPEAQEQLEAYKMEADEGKEINAELKAENEELKKKCNIYTCGICGNKEDCNKLYKTLTEIKDFFKEECLICKENYINITGEICKECKYQDILKKINEVE